MKDRNTIIILQEFVITLARILVWDRVITTHCMFGDEAENSDKIRERLK
jgi:hypothetical protein